MNWKRALGAAALSAPIIALFAWGFTRDPAEIPSPLRGKDAPSFALPVFAPGEPPLSRTPGDTVQLAALRGQVVVLNFWASWCVACQSEHRTLSAVARQYAGRPVHFLGVLYSDRQQPALEWIARMGGQSYPTVDDPGARTAIDFGLYGVPETFFIDASGRIAFKQTGTVTADLVTHLVDSLIAAAATPAPVATKKTGP